MKLPNLRSLCCMPRPKMMRISWTLRGRLQYILPRGLLQKTHTHTHTHKDNEMKKEEPKCDETIESPHLRES